MRLIDADQLINAIKEEAIVIDFDKEINRVVVRDVEYVPVIRCKDCKWCVELHDIDIDTIAPYLQCTNWNGMTDADGYCCVAERKEE